MRARHVTNAAMALLLAAPEAGADTPAEEPTADRHQLIAHGETTLQLFRRALMPGPGGALVSEHTVAPMHQYVSLRALDLDGPLGEDSLDIELSAWGSVFIGDPESTRRTDGDVQSANVRLRHGPLAVRLGRQLVAGGAARYARFDGARAGAALGSGFDADAYGGFTVLPRWDARPGYHHLGAAYDSLLIEPNALPEPDRSGHWLAGGRIGYARHGGFAGLSFHEQHETGGVSRRNLAADARYQPSAAVSVGGFSLMELDARRFADARVFVDTTPARPLDLSVELRRTEPALYLSRQSVLSVFSTDGYDEAGTQLVFRALPEITFDGAGAVQLYDDTRRGARGELGVRVAPGVAQSTVARLGFTRVLAVDNGYHALRASVAQRFSPAFTGTVEVYGYLYDEAIERHSTSSVLAGTLSYQLSEALRVLWGSSLAQSPYARFDAQTLLRAAYDFDLAPRRGAL